MPNQQSSSINAANYFATGLSEDIHDLFKDEKGWLAARNAVISSPLNDFNSLSNEMSNFNVANAPYTIIGTIYINDGQWAIFSTDDTNSEIGVFDEKDDSYTPYVNSTDLNFKKSNLIKGVGRIKGHCHRTIYWDDDLNPSRYLDLDNIPWVGEYSNLQEGECKIFQPSIDYNYKHQDKEHRNADRKYLDIKKIYLTPFSDKGLQFRLSKGTAAGEIVNGTYTVVGYYSYGGSSNPLTSYYSISNPQPIFVHNNAGGSLEVDVEQCDESFEEFTLFVHYREEGSLRFYKVGTYSTSVKKIYITQIKQDVESDVIEKIFTETKYPVRSAGIYKINNNLLRIRPTMHQKFNYQKQANKINVNWVSVKYPTDYYRNGGNNIGYMRDEVYSFFIRWVYNTGEKSELYHIPGRKSNSSDVMDINEYIKTFNQESDEYRYIKSQLVLGDIDERAGSRTEKWRYVNTARESRRIENEGIRTQDGGVLYAMGEMGYWESNEYYNDKKPNIYGELCGQHIRHHKMPNNIVSPHYGTDGTGTYIYVLGVHFSHIEKPQKFSGYDKRGKAIYTDIEDIIGYEILRGSREGNASIIAKGMINNMRLYDSYDGDQILYQNYPYNPISNSDLFITKNKLQFHNFANNSLKRDPRYKEMSSRKRGYRYLANANTLKEESANDIYDYKNYVSHNYFTFHSPDLKLNSDKESLTRLTAKEIDTYMVMLGTMKDTKFIVPKGAPKQKLMMTSSLIVSMSLGMGFALFKMYGVKHNIISAPEIDHGPAMAGYGVVEMSNGNAGVSAPNATLQNVSSLAATCLNNILTSVVDNYGKLLGATSGTDVQKTINQLKEFLGNAEGAIGGKGAKSTTETTETEWTSIPGIMKKLSKIPMFLSFWGRGINNVFEMLYAFAPYRDHILQQVSHGYYDDLKNLRVSKRYSLTEQGYVNRDAFTQLQDGKIVNNIKRNDTVVIKTNFPISSVELMSNSKGIEYSQILASDISYNKNLASYYSALKQPLPSQYGQIESIFAIPASYKVILNDKDSNPTYENVIFGGDTFIGRYTEKNTMFFFYDWLNGQANGEPYNYWDYPMINYPRFWMNTNHYDITHICDLVSKLFNNKTSVDFDPFQKSSRFIDEEIVIDKLTLPNPETVISNMSLRYVNDKNSGFFYPQYVRDHDDNEEVKVNYALLYSPDYDTNPDSIDEAINELTVLENRNIETLSDDLTDEEKAQKHLARFNDNRRCSCDYKFLLSKIDEGFQVDSERETNYKTKKDSKDNENESYVDAYYLLSKEETKNNEAFIYSHNNPYSPINCEFFKYEENKAKNYYDISEGKLREFGKERTENLWYDKPFRLKVSDYDKLCNLKKNIKKAELDYAILLGYIHFLQQIVDVEDDGTNEEFEDENGTEANVQFCPSCWTRKRMTNKRRAKKNRKVHRDVVEYFENGWHDDYTLSYDYGMKGLWYGISDGIPYTRATDKINPLLAYFIQQETDIVLNYPNIEYNSLTHRYRLKFDNCDVDSQSNNVYKALLWDKELLEGNETDGFIAPSSTYPYKVVEGGVKYIVYGEVVPPYTTYVEETEDGISIVLKNEDTGECIVSKPKGNEKKADKLSAKVDAMPADEIAELFEDYYDNLGDDFKGEGKKARKASNAISNKIQGYLPNILGALFGGVPGLFAADFFKTKWKKEKRAVEDGGTDEKKGDYQDNDNELFPLSFITMIDGGYSSSLYRIFESFDSWKEAIGYEEDDELKNSESDTLTNFYKDIDNKDIYKIRNYKYTSNGINETLYRKENSNTTLDDIIITLESRDDNVEYDDIYTSYNISDSNFYLKYWTIDGVRSILSKRLKKKKRKVYNWYSIKPSSDSSGKQEIIKGEKCDQLQKYFSDSGVLYRIQKRYSRDIEKANKKYQKLVQKFNRHYVKNLAKQDHTTFFDRIKAAINSITPASYYALDYVGGGTELASLMPEKFNNAPIPGLSKLSLFAHDMYMYQFVSGVRDFYVESRKNIDLRDWENNNAGRFYDNLLYNNLSQIFNTDDIDKRELFIYEESLTPSNMFHLHRNVFAKQAELLNDTWNEEESLYCNSKFMNRVLYSNTDSDTEKSDSWRIYLKANYKDFNDEITSIISYGENGSALLFRNSSPIMFTDSINFSSDNTTMKLRVTTGTGELMNNAQTHMEGGVDSFEYGSCQDSYSAISTPSGIFYVSQDQGKILTFKSGLLSSKTSITEMSSYASGLNAWFRHYIPYMLIRDKQVFENVEFELTDNPVSGIGFISSYDNSNHVLYVSKKDYRVKHDYRDILKYKGNGLFTGKFDSEITLGDPKYFDDASFTISYDNRIGKNGSFVSWHDWHPDLIMNSKERIYSTKDKGIWKHNYSAHKIGSFNPFCNFYGTDYPFEVEFTINSENTVSTLRNISYFLECFVYDENDYDRFHKLFENFDEAMIYNTEQISGKLKLNHQKKDNPDLISEYPKVENDHIDILWSKEEQRYRFNQFWDITKNREDDYNNTMFITKPNGYVREINPKYVNYDKDEFQRKKFRHRINKVRLTKTKSGDINLVFSLSMNHNLTSFR